MRPDIEIRTCDGWVAVYKNGKRVWNSHACPLQEGLRALGIPYIHRDFDDQMDHGLGILMDGTDPFPKGLDYAVSN